MILKIYSIYDKVAMEYGGLFECKNHQVAIRNYQIFMDNKPCQDDYRLVYFGQFDRETGNMEILGIPETLPVAKTPEIQGIEGA